MVGMLQIPINANRGARINLNIIECPEKNDTEININSVSGRIAIISAQFLLSGCHDDARKSSGTTR